MKNLQQGLRVLAVTIAMTLPWSALQALDSFAQSGKIRASRDNILVVGDRLYRIYPNARFVTLDASRQRISDLKTGDHISMLGNIVGSSYYVDFIQYGEGPDEEED